MRLRQRGCLEQYASATGVVSNYLRECESRGVEPIELSGPSDFRSVFQACREGDEVALAAVDVIDRNYLARGLQIISAVVDPEVYVLGGGASASADVYLDQLREKFAACALSVSVKTPHRGRRAGQRRRHHRRRLRGASRRLLRGVNEYRAYRMPVRRPGRRCMWIAVDEEVGSEWGRSLIVQTARVGFAMVVLPMRSRRWALGVAMKQKV